MIKVLIDGVEHQLPIHDQENFDSLLKTVRGKYVNDSSLISSIRVDGLEIGETEERALAGVMVDQMQNIEISTKHPHEVARETLELLIAFTEHLTGKSQEVAMLMRRAEPEAALASREQLGNLLDGLTTFAESLKNVREVLGIKQFGPVDIAEADLASILSDIMEFQQKSEHLYAAQMLDEDLPRNFQEWREVAIPALMASNAAARSAAKTE